jgi:hypothetical protein
MDFIVTNPRLLNKGTLIGSFDLETPWGIKVIGAMLFEKEGKRWIHFPSKEWVKQDGTKGYFPLLEWIDQEARGKFQKEVLPLAERELVPTTALKDPQDRMQRQRGQSNDGPNDMITF